MERLIGHPIRHPFQFVLQGLNRRLLQEQVGSVLLRPGGAVGQTLPVHRRPCHDGTDSHQSPGMSRLQQEALRLGYQRPLECLLSQPPPFGPPVLQVSCGILEHTVQNAQAHNLFLKDLRELFHLHLEVGRLDLGQLLGIAQPKELVMKIPQMIPWRGRSRLPAFTGRDGMNDGPVNAIIQ